MGWNDHLDFSESRGWADYTPDFCDCTARDENGRCRQCGAKYCPECGTSWPEVEHGFFQSSQWSWDGENGDFVPIPGKCAYRQCDKGPDDPIHHGVDVEVHNEACSRGRDKGA
jgi:hypothetical protein